MQQELCFCSLPCLPGLCTGHRRQPPRSSYWAQQRVGRAGSAGWCRASRKIEDSGGHACRAQARTWYEGTAADDGPSWCELCTTTVSLTQRFLEPVGCLADQAALQGWTWVLAGGAKPVTLSSTETPMGTWRAQSLLRWAATRWLPCCARGDKCTPVTVDAWQGLEVLAVQAWFACDRG